MSDDTQKNLTAFKQLSIFRKGYDEKLNALCAQPLEADLSQPIIPPDATLAGIRHRLLDPVNHVRDVLETMSPVRKQFGNASVRIGVTGEGKHPHHKVFYLDEAGREIDVGWYDGVHERALADSVGGWSTRR